MKKKFLFVALSALALTACVNDETIEVNPGDALTFRATSGNATKSQITSTSTIKDFKVWGYYQNEAEKQSNVPFMEAQEVVKNGDVWTYSPTRFWPESGTIDFYSVSPASVNASISGSSQKIENYTVSTNVDEQIDLLYAVNKDCSKADNGQSGVQVNFRHALSQIVFKAKNTNANIEVDIKGVTIVNVIENGSFTFPTETTSPLQGYNVETEADNTWGTWELSNTTKDYAAGIKETTVKYNDSKYYYGDVLTVKTGELLLLPQKLTAWGPSTGINGAGSRFLIDCRIRNISGDHEIQIWPGTDDEDGYAQVAVPVEADWKQGRKYTYTFIFGDGAGYTPEGEEAVAKIKFDVSVDNFQESSENVSMTIPVDMSEDEKTYGGGNCYVIPQATKAGEQFSFDATKEGRTNDPVGTVVKGEATPISGAELIYQDTKNLITDVTFANGDIIVTPGLNKTGNAIVAVTDKEGTILWSWHLWVVADNSFMTNPPASGSLMDRDLGSSGVITDNEMPANTGLYYQWGRHNPQFLFGEDAIQGKKSLEEAIQQPHIFITGVAEGDKRVLWNSEERDWKKANPWANSLSKYDPTPAGWTIPEDYTFYNKNDRGYFTDKYEYTYNKEKGYVKLERKEGVEETVTLPICHYYNELTGLLVTDAEKTRGSWLINRLNKQTQCSYSYFLDEEGETESDYQMWARACHIRPIKE